MQKNHNLSNIIKKEHEGKWVALSPAYDRVVDFSDSLVLLTQKVGDTDVVYMKALASDVHFAF
jgi:hypothetical protein